MLQWSEIADDFRHGLVLGNGASQAFDRRFAYRSLLQAAREGGFIDGRLEAVFEHLGTADFEWVLRILWHAVHVNRCLGTQRRRVETAYRAVREALIRTVRAVHVDHATVADRLDSAGRFLERFETVASLNYDLLVYWALLRRNEATPNRLKDCFVAGRFDLNWERFRQPYGRNASSTLVFYPHGNLMLAQSLDGGEEKLRVAESTLLEEVLGAWRDGRMAPIFVSEGTAEQKRQSIQRSVYLAVVHHEVLPRLGQSLAILGWSMQESDRHVLQALRRGAEDVGGPSRLAVSVRRRHYRGEGTFHRIRDTLEEAAPGRPFELLLFDPDSDGCWLRCRE